MSGTKASSFFEIGALSNSTPRGLTRVHSLTRPTHHSLHKKGEGRMNPSTRLLASSDPDPSSGGSFSSPLEDFDSEKVLKDVKAKWDKVEDKTTLAIYVGGALFALYLATTVVSAFDNLPLLPKLFQLVGLIYTGWFVYRYLLFKSSRQELIEDVNELKDKISGEQ